MLAREKANKLMTDVLLNTKKGSGLRVSERSTLKGAKNVGSETNAAFFDVREND